MRGEEEEFVVVFAAMGLTAREADYFTRSFEEGGQGQRVVAFMNKADDPAIERLFRAALCVDDGGVPSVR